MKVPSNKVAKYMLFVGVALVMLLICVVSALEISTMTWTLILIALPIVVLILASGFIYTENIKKTNRKRFWTIRIISTVYIIGIIALIVSKLSNKLA